jgi:Tat protein translocase TatB subunit
MFNIGPEEIILILVVALIFLGPAKLPEMARQMGKGLREFRSLSKRAQDELFETVSFDVGDLPEADVVPELNGSSPAVSNGRSNAPQAEKDEQPVDAAAGEAAALSGAAAVSADGSSNGAAAAPEGAGVPSERVGDLGPPEDDGGAKHVAASLDHLPPVPASPDIDQIERSG